MKMLTKTQVKVILILLDDKGHAGWELAKYLGEKTKERNLNPILKDLEKIGIIFQGEPRKSNNRQKRTGDYKEFPYYLSKSLDDFKTLICEIATTSRPYDPGFLLEIIDNSKYIKIMEEKFKEDINSIIGDELRKSDSPYSDPFFVNIIKPELEDELFGKNLEILPVSEIQVWHEKYLRMHHSNKVNSSNN
jgi:hypothetical protein